MWAANTARPAVQLDYVCDLACTYVKIEDIKSSRGSRTSGTNVIELSPRERQFLRRLAAGKTDAQIAERLGGSVKQISEQRARLLAKLAISSPAEIADAAERLARSKTYHGIT